MKGPIRAVAVLTNTTVKGMAGYVEFEEDLANQQVVIRLRLKGVPAGYHGFHVHQAGDLRDQCTSACAHFNPDDKTHGGPKDAVRHVGDLGNIYANASGVVHKTLKDKMITLRGKNNILGRSIVIHQDKDDLGRGGLNREGKVINAAVHQESLKTGNAGARIACGVIGFSKEMFC